MNVPEPRVNLLMVDDQDSNLVALEACLEVLGENLVQARSGEEALKALLEQDFAAILLDVQMPGMDGFETADLIRRRERTRHTPILFLTAINKSDTHVLRGYALGAVDYMFKPIVPEILRSKVQAFVELFKMRQRETLIATALAQKTRELERSNAELEQFAHVVAHDLQEPLRSVTGYLKLLERRHAEALAPEAPEFVHFAVDGAQRMRQLILDLLEYARVGQATEPAPTPLDAALDRVLRSLRAAIEESGAEVTRDPLPTVVADAGQVERLLLNLIGNALKFKGKDPPRIHVGVQRRANDWLFSVKDNGIGIEGKDLERVFVLFQRLHGREQPGSGIGLAVCKKIVERHGGRIWAESDPGQGTILSFTLPIAAAAPTARG